MKTALCLFGLVGGIDGPFNKGKELDCKITYNHYKKHILDKNDVDVFIHTWSINQEDVINNLYNPTLITIEKQIIFDKNDEVRHNKHSRWYSVNKSINLKKIYEKENNFKYDCVMLSRLDVAFFTDLIFDSYDMNCFWASHWNDVHNKVNHSERNIGLLDLWFFSNSEMMDKYSEIYKKVDSISNFGTMASGDYVRNNITKKIGYTLYRWYDFELARRRIYDCKE